MEKLPDLNRRKFLKTTGITTLGVILAPELLAKNTEKEEQTKLVEKEIEKCKKIIKDKHYEDIPKNPYLVSALYYSAEYGQELQNEKQDGQKKIVSEIYPLITREFREKYIELLTQIAEKQEKLLGLNFDTKCQPLETYTIPKNLNKNHKNALDIFAKEGSPVSAISGGIVVLAESNWEKDNEFSTSSNLGGNTIIIFNPKEKSFYRYAHMREVNTSVMKGVTSGSYLGSIGNTGKNASKTNQGEHLHLEINKYNQERGLMESVTAEEIKNAIFKQKL